MKATINGMALSVLLLGLHTPVNQTEPTTEPTAKTQGTVDLVHLVDQTPVSIKEVEPGTYLVDFGKVAFGNIVFNSPTETTVTVHYGEAMKDGRINRTPPGTVRYAKTQTDLKANTPQVVAPAADRRNTETNTNAHPPAILTPKEWDVVLPFRWVEIEGWSGELKPEHIKRQAAFAKSWDDAESDFHSSDPMLNQVWDLCKYSIKATTFAGIFVDGDRERIPYEADAYLNQLSYYATSTDDEIARATFDHLMKHGTWPTEWAFHMVFMAHADWMRTGDKAWLEERYDALKTKLHSDRVGEDGLVHSSQEDKQRTDIVDWPVGERDGYVFTPRNTVVNSFYIRCLHLMAEMASELGKEADAAHFTSLESKATETFQKTFFDTQTGLYKDGDETDHKSLHANLFPLAFGQVPEPHRAHVAEWLANRGMRCSVYAAQYLLEALFENGQSKAALDLMLAPNDRSWRHMVNSGTTITWEAWDQKYKPNQDWNHAWGAAPANLLPRYILGAQPLTPGWTQALIKPHPASLNSAQGKIPTPHGPLTINWTAEKSLTLNLNLPKGMTAQVNLPALPDTSEVLVNNKPAKATRQGDRWILESPVTGSVKVELR